MRGPWSPVMPSSPRRAADGTTGVWKPPRSISNNAARSIELVGAADGLVAVVALREARNGHDGIDPGALAEATALRLNHGCLLLDG